MPTNPAVVSVSRSICLVNEGYGTNAMFAMQNILMMLVNI